MKRNLNTPKKELSDEEYWKQYQLQKNEEDFESMQNHDINMEIICKFNGLNGVIFETKEKDINCNLDDLETWFSNLKKTIRMLDESVVDKEVGEGF
jgi:hypothetical protein